MRYISKNFFFEIDSFLFDLDCSERLVICFVFSLPVTQVSCHKGTKVRELFFIIAFLSPLWAFVPWWLNSFHRLIN